MLDAEQRAGLDAHDSRRLRTNLRGYARTGQSAWAERIGWVIDSRLSCCEFRDRKATGPEDVCGWSFDVQR